jgi:hypothetical protein
MFADAREFRRARAAEAAQFPASTPPLPSPEPAITGPEDAPTRERAPTVPPAPMSDATRNACIREFVAACEPLLFNAPPGDPAHDPATWDPSIGPRVVRGPNAPGRQNLYRSMLIQRNQNDNVLAGTPTSRESRGQLDFCDSTSSCSNLSRRPHHSEATPITENATETQEQEHAEDNDQGLVATTALTMRQWPFPQVAARRNEDDPIEEWGRDSERATPRDDPPMPKAAKRGKAWVGTEAPLGTPIQGQSAQAASSPTNTKRTQAPAETRAVETGPGREMLSTVEEPG